MQAEEALQFLGAIVDSTDDAIIRKTPEGTILSWNRGAERMFGYRARDVRGKPMSLITPPDRYDELTNIMRQVRRGKRIEHMETIGVGKNGHLTHCFPSLPTGSTYGICMPGQLLRFLEGSW
jgi:PAS domain S-box-containing protein